MGTCLDRGIKVVSNAGGLDPGGCAEAVAEVADRLGLAPTIAYVDGDDLLPRLGELIGGGTLAPFVAGGELGDAAGYVTANAYLGCFGIVEALAGGADIVITGRVTDAAVACGPAAWRHGWTPADLDQLAGGVVAGHLIECSAQVTGGNYSFFHEIDRYTDPDGVRFGFPWADVAADGSCVIGKHDGTGGVVNVETVTSQLLYEIAGPEYPGPDVTARFDTLAVEQVAPDRVRVSGAVGLPPPATLKVAMNEHGGYRNSFSVALTGLDIEQKAAFAEAVFWDACPYGPDDFESIDARVVRTESVDPPTQEEATALWRVTVKDRDERKVGRAVTDAMVHTVLAGIPGMYSPGGGPSAATPFGVYRPATIPAELVPQYVHVLGGATTLVEPSVPRRSEPSTPPPSERPDRNGPSGPVPNGHPPDTVTVPLGSFVGTRSGDKGGDANLGVYARDDAGWAWIDRELTVDLLRRLLPETATLAVDRYRFANLRALNFVIRGLLQEGVAASTRQDPQAKALGEWLRARLVTVPASVTSGVRPLL